MSLKCSFALKIYILLNFLNKNVKLSKYPFIFKNTLKFSQVSSISKVVTSIIRTIYDILSNYEKKKCNFKMINHGL